LTEAEKMPNRAFEARINWVKPQKYHHIPTHSSLLPDGSGVLKPYVLNWRPNSVQKELLENHERRLRRQGQSQAEAKQGRLELTATLEREATWGTQWEQEIRKAIYADHRALRYLRFLLNGDGVEWTTIIRLSMWAHAGDEHPGTRESRRDLLIPRDQVLVYLRERSAKGATHAELAENWLSYGTYLIDLRRNGFKFQTIRFKNDRGENDYRYILKEDRKRYKLVTKRDEYARIARAIENLGNPPLLREAGRHAGMMSRSKAILGRRLEESPLSYRWKGLVEDDIIRVAGNHLKRMTYLMAVAQRTVWKSAKSTDDLSRVLFQRLHKRMQRHAEKSKTS
jgi:hypothetical protein